MTYVKGVPRPTPVCFFWCWVAPYTAGLTDPNAFLLAAVRWQARSNPGFSRRISLCVGEPGIAFEEDQDTATARAPLVLYGPFAARLDVVAGPSPPTVPPYFATGPG